MPGLLRVVGILDLSSSDGGRLSPLGTACFAPDCVVVGCVAFHWIWHLGHNVFEKVKVLVHVHSPFPMKGPQNYRGHQPICFGVEMHARCAYLHVVNRHLFRTSAARLFDCLFYNARHEQFQCFRCAICLCQHHSPEMHSGKSGRADLQIRTGVACATLPTSSSACMIFLIRATGNLHCVERFTIVKKHGSSRWWC